MRRSLSVRLVVLQSMVSRHVEKLKNVQRIHESMKMYVYLSGIEELGRSDVFSVLSTFLLLHQSSTSASSV